MAKPYIIVLGNEKGGSGKTTTSMHLIFSLIYKNFTVSTIDLDFRQLSLNRYLENRKLYYKNLEKETFLMPSILEIPKNILESRNEDEIENYFNNLFETIATDFIIIDTPGTNNPLSCVAHSFADLIITPMNDSFIDLDLIASISGNDLKTAKPSIYSSMIWEQKIKRLKRDKKKIEWVIIRNRLSNLDSNNRRNIEKTLHHLSKTLALKIGSGFSERIIYRELFPYGLTLLDVFDNQSIIKITTSHIAARQELRNFINDLRIPLLSDNQNLQENSLKLKEKILELTDKIYN
jgi:chromosome partitioning protein